MSALQRLPVIAGVTGLGAVMAIASFSSVQSFVSRHLGLSAPGGTWRVVAVILAILNIKGLPFVWHIRLFRGLLYQLYIQPTPLSPSSLFEPVITSTRSPIAECDYNLHKSNSTYFSDLDISRTHLVSALLKKGIRKLNENQKQSAKSNTSPSTSTESNGTTQSHPGADALPPQPFAIALGAVSCHFRREIQPYERYEIWTRLLCWDRKWLYLVSHFVRPGVVPGKYSLQPSRKGGKQQQQQQQQQVLSAEEEAARKEGFRKAIFASSMAKYVVKKGRLTIPPEQVLMRSDLLPPKPYASMASSTDSSSADSGSSTSPTPAEVLEESFFPSSGSDGEWAWARVEAERRRGLKFAEMFAGLDGLHDAFDGGVNGAMGQFGDLFW